MATIYSKIAASAAKDNFSLAMAMAMIIAMMMAMVIAMAMAMAMIVAMMMAMVIAMAMAVAIAMAMTSAFSQSAFAGLDSFGAGTAFVSTGQGVFTSIVVTKSFRNYLFCNSVLTFALCQDLRWQL